MEITVFIPLQKQELKLKRDQLVVHLVGHCWRPLRWSAYFDLVKRTAMRPREQNTMASCMSSQMRTAPQIDSPAGAAGPQHADALPSGLAWWGRTGTGWYRTTMIMLSGPICKAHPEQFCGATHSAIPSHVKCSVAFSGRYTRSTLPQPNEIDRITLRQHRYVQ